MFVFSLGYRIKTLPQKGGLGLGCSSGAMCEALVSSIKKVFKYLSLRRQRTPKTRVLREMECQVVVWVNVVGSWEMTTTTA